MVDCMGYLYAVKERQQATDEMFEPLKQTIELLKTFEQELPEEVHLQLQVSFFQIYVCHWLMFVIDAYYSLVAVSLTFIPCLVYVLNIYLKNISCRNYIYYQNIPKTSTLYPFINLNCFRSCQNSGTTQRKFPLQSSNKWHHCRPQKWQISGVILLHLMLPNTSLEKVSEEQVHLDMHVNSLTLS